MRRPRRLDRSSVAGFTLIEALVSITLMAFIFTALATITAQWLPNWNHGIARVQRNDLMSLGLERLAGDLAAAEFIAASQQNRKPFFDGKSRSVTFVRTSVGPNKANGLEIIRIAEVSTETGLALVRTRAPFAPGVDHLQLPFTEPVVLIRAPYRVSFAYAGTDRIWRDEWRDQIQLPSSVRLIVRDAVTQRTLSLSSATLIRAEIPLDCLAAKSLGECRASLRPPVQDGKSRS